MLLWLLSVNYESTQVVSYTSENLVLEEGIACVLNLRSSVTEIQVSSKDLTGLAQGVSLASWIVFRL